MQVAAVHCMAAAFDDLAAALVPALPGDEATILEAIRDQANHHLQHLSSASDTAFNFIGWDNSLGQFCAVADCRQVEDRLVCSPSRPVAHVTVAGPSPLLLDLLAPKLGAITSGVEAACTLLKVDSMGAAYGSNHA